MRENPVLEPWERWEKLQTSSLRLRVTVKAMKMKAIDRSVGFVGIAVPLSVGIMINLGKRTISGVNYPFYFVQLGTHDNLTFPPVVRVIKGRIQVEVQIIKDGKLSFDPLALRCKWEGFIKLRVGISQITILFIGGIYVLDGQWGKHRLACPVQMQTRGRT